MNRSSRARERSSGFTLIELMVALTLSAMLSIMIMMISTTAQSTYSETVQRVQIYNNFRFVMDQLRNDIASWLPSQELEFYTDGRGSGSRRNFRYDPGEELPDRSDEYGQGMIDGGTTGYDEFAYVIQQHYKSVEQNQINLGDIEEKVHDCYQMYFRTMTYVEGQVREANVEYMLVDPSAPKARWTNGVPPIPEVVDTDNVPNLSLYKVVRFLQIDEDIITKINQVPVDREIIEVATNVTDFRVEYVTRNPFSRSKKAGSPIFVTPEVDYGKPAEMATRPKRLKKGISEARSYRKDFGYGSVKLAERYDLAIATPMKWGDQGLKNLGSRSEPVRFGFRSNPRITFAELSPGDEIYIFTDASRGSPAGTAGSAARLSAFPAGTYTVKANIQGMLEFIEDIDSTTWKDRDQTGIRYKAAFLPVAVRVTIRMVDDDGLNPKTMQQVIWLRRKAR